MQAISCNNIFYHNAGEQHKDTGTGLLKNWRRALCRARAA